MRVAWTMLGGAAFAAALALPHGAPVNAAEKVGTTTIAAEELDRRSRQPEESKNGGLSESAVRVMVTYAFSLIPDQTQGPDGKPVKVDKSDPNKYVIPSEDARQVIRAATRSAYADICGLPELGQANYRALMAQEESKKTRTREQILMIQALHLFAMSYFTGNAKITEGPAQGTSESTEAESSSTTSKDQNPEASREVEAPPPPKCPPEQKQKVENAINAYVAEAGGN